MKKTIALAAVIAASFAVPALPVQAASAVPSHCVIFPLLKADCRAAIAEAAKTTPIAVASATSATVTAASPVEWPVPAWWNCEPAPAGSGHLFDCL